MLNKRTKSDNEVLHNMIHTSGVLPVERRHDVVSTGISGTHFGVWKRGG